MKTVKMSLANIQGKLNRSEMKSINGGVNQCTKDTDCGSPCSQDPNLLKGYTCRFVVSGATTGYCYYGFCP